MKHLTSETKQQQLNWRRAQVLELASEGYTQREIANKLQLDLTAVNRDIQFLRQQAQDNLEHHIHKTLPEEYMKCMVGMKRNLKQTLEIAENTADPKVKLQARAIVNDCYKYIMDLTTNGRIISDSITYVQAKLEGLYSDSGLKIARNKIKESELEKTDIDSNTTTNTTNGVF
jgi:DNA-binding transcriptional regulator LsrR (DeoR family)